MRRVRATATIRPAMPSIVAGITTASPFGLRSTGVCGGIDKVCGGIVRLRTFVFGLGVSLSVLMAHASHLSAADMPEYMSAIVGGQPPSPAETARQNVLALNSAMFGSMMSPAASSKRISWPNIPSSWACSPEPAAASFFTNLALPRSKRLPCRSFIS